MKKFTIFNLQFSINDQRGQLSLLVLLFGAVAITIMGGFVIWADSQLRIAQRSGDQTLALRIAESGLEYYRWHLAHNPFDFQDGTAQPGPYTHDFKDKDGNIIGQFILDITAPPLGGTLVTIKSTGKITANPDVEKIVRVRLDGGSLLRFAAVSNTDIYFPPGTEVFGPIHSNGGVHFDGIAHNVVTSALAEYNDPDHSGNNEYGVHTHVAPADPLATSPPSIPNRPDVFKAGRQFPVPPIDFTGLTSDIATIKAAAQQNGRYFAPAGNQYHGYHIVLKTNDTF